MSLLILFDAFLVVSGRDTDHFARILVHGNDVRFFVIVIIQVQPTMLFNELVRGIVIITRRT